MLAFLFLYRAKKNTNSLFNGGHVKMISEKLE